MGGMKMRDKAKVVEGIVAFERSRVLPPRGFEFIAGVRLGGELIGHAGHYAHGLVSADKYGQVDSDLDAASGNLYGVAAHSSLRASALPLPLRIVPSSQLTEVRELGTGAFGKVVLVRDKRDELYAVKYPAIDKEAVLSHEAQLHMRLEHPNIARLMGIVGNPLDPHHVHGVMMEFCAGGTLAEWLDWNRGKPIIPLAARLEIADQLAAALEYMHSRGVCHLDIKPSNVMLSSADLKRVQSVKIADFGLSQTINGRPMPGRYRGTLPYMPPEMAIQQRTVAAPALDVWSLGVVLKELVTQEVPCSGWHGSDIKARLRAGSLHADPLPPALCEPEWAELVFACLEHDPACRPTASSLRCRIARLRALETHRSAVRGAGPPPVASCAAPLPSRGSARILAMLPESLGLGRSPRGADAATPTAAAAAPAGAEGAAGKSRQAKGPWWTRPGALPDLPDSLGLTSF